MPKFTFCWILAHMAFPKTVPTLMPLISTPEENTSVQDRTDFCILCLMLYSMCNNIFM